jgi:hypothetical protein
VETDEDLETGYGPAAPSGDNLLNDFVQGEAAAFAELARARGERVVEDPEFALLLTDGGSPTPFGNVAVLRRPLAQNEWPEAARRMHAFYGDQSGGPFMTFSGWPTPKVHDLGFGAIGHPPLMLRMPGPITTPAPQGFEVQPVTDVETARLFEQVMIDAYPVPELDRNASGAIVGRDLAAAPHWRHYIGLLDGQAVATGSAYVDDRHVHVEFITSRADGRGRGIGSAITAAATSTEPELPAMLIASDLGQPVYRRLGYVALSRFTLWAGRRGAGS